MIDVPVVAQGVVLHSRGEGPRCERDRRPEDVTVAQDEASQQPLHPLRLGLECLQGLGEHDRLLLDRV